MIRLFYKLCKSFKQICFNDELSTIDIYVKDLDIKALTCPFCKAKNTLSNFSSYKRNFVTYENNEPESHVITITRLICSSCEHTHAILPSVIIPYSSFSFKFTVSIIHDYLIGKFNSVEAMCMHYNVAISTFYRIFKNFIEHKKLWLGLLEDASTPDLEFVQALVRTTFFDIELFIMKFIEKTALSFFQRTS